jgi:glycerol-3-phosphate dehydrogenase
MKLSGKMRPPLDDRYHVVVIGGGINGVAIARECARGGRRTLLVEERDFAAGTTSRSTRMIHGGLRYIEHGELHLVLESLSARKRLLREYPHLVQPVQFLLALGPNSRRSALSVRVGLWLYKRMGGSNLRGHLPEIEKKRLEQWLDAGQRWSLFNFEDAQCEFPERLVAEWLVEAIQAGATVRNYMRALAVNVAHGKALGVLLRDQLTGQEKLVEASWIINATGPWADRVCQRSSIRMSQPLLGGVRGSHIVLPRFPGAPNTAIYTEATDQRPIFVVPWNDQVLVGTTEIPDTGDPGKARPSSDETEYLLRSLNNLFPRANICATDIRYAFAGVRPLPFSPHRKPDAITRRHFLHDHAEDGAGHMISIIGGKLTTAADLARECVRKIGLASSRPKTLAMAAGAALDPVLDNWVLRIADAGGVSESTARGIVEWHGKRSVDIARMALSSAVLRATICPHTEHIVAEAVDAFANECAMTLADVLLRRVPVALGACWSEACSREAAMRIGAAMNWSDSETASELEAFEEEREAFLQKPSRFAIPVETAAD